MMVVANGCSDLDGLGNWNSFTDGATTTDRTHNAANELTGIDGATIDPTYHAVRGELKKRTKGGGSRFLAQYDSRPL